MWHPGGLWHPLYTRFCTVAVQAFFSAVLTGERVTTGRTWGAIEPSVRAHVVCDTCAQLMRLESAISGGDGGDGGGGGGGGGGSAREKHKTKSQAYPPTALEARQAELLLLFRPRLHEASAGPGTQKKIRALGWSLYIPGTHQGIHSTSFLSPRARQLFVLLSLMLIYGPPPLRLRLLFFDSCTCDVCVSARVLHTWL